MTTAVAVVGMACQYPDAATPTALWENVLACRRAFRRIPAERIRIADYWSPDVTAPDRFYSTKAAVLDGYAFDRVAFRIPGSTYRSTDLAHWLALDVAAGALADAGFPGGDGLPRERTGVLVGNTLTGEFSRANVLRLRWPYVRRVLAATLVEDGLAEERVERLLARIEERYKAPFPAVDGDSLAGALSNTIAGRICNHFDLGGGGYTVDGACAASLLSVTTACAALVGGDVDVAIAGGVDLSIDPFELVGFAKAGALAVDDMRVYDRRSAGFWPGEGCGMVVLMRADDAAALGRPVYALVRGWGVSSDGSGGITRPEGDGQLLAVERAYRRAGLGVDAVGYFEGHGTGTAVGDGVELDVLSRARRAAASRVPAAIGTVKANIGHTKAAAGIAGLIKATLAVHNRLLPPTTGCTEPHPLLDGPQSALRVLSRAEAWPDSGPATAAVSSMGFGGINVHVVLGSADELAAPVRRDEGSPAHSSRRQDQELFLLGAASTIDLVALVQRLAAAAMALSSAELTDLAASLESELGDHPVRAAVVAHSPEQLEDRLGVLARWLETGTQKQLDPTQGVFLGNGSTVPRILYLFPGQGTGSRWSIKALRERFAAVEELCTGIDLPPADETVATEVAQPQIVLASLAALRALRLVGLEATAAVGHSLGELTAVHWAGGLDERGLVRLAAVRGGLIARLGEAPGAMASLAISPADVAPLMDGEPVVPACFNGPRLTVVSGEASAVDRVIRTARRRGVTASRLPVSHAFHSPLMDSAAAAFAEHLTTEPLAPLQRSVMSTVTGHALEPGTDVSEVLSRQITAPVRFDSAMRAAVPGMDLLLEIGPGGVLSGLAGQFTDAVAIPLATQSGSLNGFLCAVGAAFALGHPVQHDALFADRFSRPFDLDRKRRFLANPCESAPDVAVPLAADTATAGPSDPPGLPRPPGPPGPPGLDGVGGKGAKGTELSTVDLLRQLVADHAELPETAVTESSHLLDDLHLSSIAVGQIVVEACRRLGLPPPSAAPAYATASLSEVAQTLDSLQANGEVEPRARTSAPGIAPWIRPFSVEFVLTKLRTELAASAPAAGPVNNGGPWHVVAPPGHALAEPLGRALAGAGLGTGVLLLLPAGGDDTAKVRLMLEASRAVFSPGNHDRLVVVHSGGGGAAFAKTLHLESPAVLTTVVDVHPGKDVVPWIVAEAAASTAFSEVSYSPDGVRRVPVLRPLSLSAGSGAAPIGPDDVLLVTGGGKGITAECALAIGRDTGARLALLGRSNRAADPALAANLSRMEAAGVHHRYVRADVTDPVAVRRAVAEVQADLGTVTGVLHGAGGNVPALLRRLDETAFLDTVAPKVAGLRAVLEAIDRQALRLLITFGSVIGRAGMRGEAAYAVANEWMTLLTEQVHAELPACRCLAVEWSVWSGVGMGERLGAVEALEREGVTPIGPDEGIASLRRLLAAADSPPTVAVTGRVAASPTIRFETRELPLMRFLEQPRVHYPDIELVADATLSSTSDPYLDEHILDGHRLLPAVIGMEALAQAAMAVTGADSAPVLERVEFTRPIAVPPAGATVRVAALVDDSGAVDAAVRTGETGFEVDHFRATCRFGALDAQRPSYGGAAEHLAAGPPAVPLDPARELYGSLLFQAGRFRRVTRYLALRARGCVAEIDRSESVSWFGPYLPARLVLGDPGIRDACLHAVQCCIPGTTLVPVGVERFCRYPTAEDGGPVTVHARERSHHGDRYTYDLVVLDVRGKALESWDGLQLQAVGSRTDRRPMPPALLGPHLERGLGEFAGFADVTVAVGPSSPVNGNDSARGDSERSLQRALGRRASIHYRPDGRPEVEGDEFVSAAHCEDVVVAVSSRRTVACDIETVVARPVSTWTGLVGADGVALARRLAEGTGETEDSALTRIWSVSECVRKVGHWSVTPCSLDSTSDGWALFSVGALRIATVVVPLVSGKLLTFGILTERSDAAWKPTSSDTLSASRRPISSATSTS